MKKYIILSTVLALFALTGVIYNINGGMFGEKTGKVKHEPTPEELAKLKKQAEEFKKKMDEKLKKAKEKAAKKKAKHAAKDEDKDEDKVKTAFEEAGEEIKKASKD